jgi:7-keto-8-aminopelargonate synthetase-like enzyme
MVKQVRTDGENVRLALFDTVSTFSGVRFPWEALVKVCKETEALSLVDGAHGIGQIDLRHVGKVAPDFFFSNCHKYVSTTLSVSSTLGGDGNLTLPGNNSLTPDTDTDGYIPHVFAQSFTFPSEINT